MITNIELTNDTLTYTTDGTIVTSINISESHRDALLSMLTSGEVVTLDKIKGALQGRQVIVASQIVTNDSFIVQGNVAYHRDVPNISIPELLLGQMYPTPPQNLLNFWKLAALNPNPAARDGLFWFLDTHGFEITDQGYFVAYRNVVKTDTDGLFTDQHTRTTRIRLGEAVTIDRTLCDHDPRNSCSRGLHVASKTWLSSNYFGDIGVLCLVNPMNVVAVPPSDSYGKMRVCEYLPIGTIVYDDDGTIKQETSYMDYSFDFDKLTVASLDAMIRNPQLIIEDGTIKTITTGNSDYRTIIQAARNAITGRVVSVPADNDYDDDFDEMEDWTW